MKQKRVAIILRGFPGSGKTMAAQELCDEFRILFNTESVIVSADDYWMKDGKYCFDVSKLFLAHLACFENFTKAVRSGKNVIVDNTNLKFGDFRKYFEALIEINNSSTEFIYSADILEVVYNSIDKAIELRSNREDGKNISKEKMLQMYETFKNSNCIKLMEDKYAGKLPFHFCHENIIEVKEDTRQKAVICDLDGTLSLFELADGSKLRNAYDASSADLDIINEPVARALVGMEKAGIKVVFVSGRTDNYRDQTLRFLDRVEKEYGLVSRELNMRSTGDRRPDEIVKKELYENFVEKVYKVIGVFDDRPKVIRLWRSLGLFVFDCGKGIEF